MPQFLLPPPKPADNVTIDKFKHDRLPTACVQLARGNNQVSETWVLASIAGVVRAVLGDCSRRVYAPRITER
jgi:hypothetical protein